MNEITREDHYRRQWLENMLLARSLLPLEQNLNHACLVYRWRRLREVRQLNMVQNRFWDRCWGVLRHLNKAVTFIEVFCPRSG